MSHTDGPGLTRAPSLSPRVCVCGVRPAAVATRKPSKRTKTHKHQTHTHTHTHTQTHKSSYAERGSLSLRKAREEMGVREGEKSGWVGHDHDNNMFAMLKVSAAQRECVM